MQQNDELADGAEIKQKEKKKKKEKAMSYRGSCKVDKELLFSVWWHRCVSQ